MELGDQTMQHLWKRAAIHTAHAGWDLRKALYCSEACVHAGASYLMNRVSLYWFGGSYIALGNKNKRIKENKTQYFHILSDILFSKSF